MPGTRGFLDKYPIDVLAKYEAGLYTFIEERHPTVFTELADKKVITEDIDKMLRTALGEYDEEFKDTIK